MEAAAGSVIAFDCSLLHGPGLNKASYLRRGILNLYIRSWLKPQTDHKRSFPTERIQDLNEIEARLLGFQRQSPTEDREGRPSIIDGPGATAFYGRPLGEVGY